MVGLAYTKHRKHFVLSGGEILQVCGFSGNFVTQKIQAGLPPSVSVLFASCICVFQSPHALPMYLRRCQHHNRLPVEIQFQDPQVKSKGCD